MGYFIKPIGENRKKTEYKTPDDASKYAEIHVENYPKGYEVVDDDGVVVFTDKREVVSRVDLIDMD